MTDDLGTAMNRSYQVALLLSGCEERAESLLLDAIAGLDPCDSIPEQLLPRTVIAALALPPYSSPVPELPRELQRVLQLNHPLRHSYVLRVLLQWPRETCSRLLGLSAGNVDENVCAAAMTLALPTSHRPILESETK